MSLYALAMTDAATATNTTTTMDAAMMDVATKRNEGGITLTYLQMK